MNIFWHKVLCFLYFPPFSMMFLTTGIATIVGMQRVKAEQFQQSFSSYRFLAKSGRPKQDAGQSSLDVAPKNVVSKSAGPSAICCNLVQIKCRLLRVKTHSKTHKTKLFDKEDIGGHVLNFERWYYENDKSTPSPTLSCVLRPTNVIVNNSSDNIGADGGVNNGNGAGVVMVAPDFSLILLKRNVNASLTARIDIYGKHIRMHIRTSLFA
uniref:Uncharacterized protein n=1 Tax=Glossina pallidipes TaxID=7398 RepID=A0A1A9Z2L9_GLOPL